MKNRRIVTSVQRSTARLLQFSVYMAFKFAKFSSLITAPINQNFIEKGGAKV